RLMPECRGTSPRFARALSLDSLPRRPYVGHIPFGAPMERREVLRALGATAALSFLPRNAHAVWELVEARRATTAAALSPAQAALVNAVGDTILPRTDTPSA